MTLAQVLKQLKSLGNEKTRAQNAKWGAGPNQHGVKHGDIRSLAKGLQSQPELAQPLWETGNVDAQLLAILLMRPKLLSAEDVASLVRTISCAPVADWLVSYVVKRHAAKEQLRQRWITSPDRWEARVGWSLTAERVGKDREGLDLGGLLDRIEEELGTADPVVQWTMNNTLAEIGIQVASLRRRAVEIGERHGLYREYPVSRGCTSPYAPIWIAALVSRRK